MLNIDETNKPCHHRIRTCDQEDAQAIKAYGETLALKPGLTLEADVLQERRKVWEWVLEPVLAARQQMKVLNADPNKVREGV